MRPATRLEPEPSPPAAVARRARPDVALALALALALVGVYSANCEVLPGGDAVPNVYLAAGILDQGRMSFTPARFPFLFDWELRTETGAKDARPLSSLTPAEGRALYARGLLVPIARYNVARSVRSDDETHEPAFVNVFGPGPALCALIVLLPLRAFAGTLQDKPELLWFGSKLAASIFVAASAALVFLTARRWLARRPALLLAAAYGLATGVWSTSSQALWQHAPNALFLALGMYGLTGTTRRSAALAGAAFAAATACRPTSATFAAAGLVWLAVANRRALLPYLGAALPLALALAAYNTWFFGTPLGFGQTEAAAQIALAKTGSADPWQTPLWEGLAGLLLSPSRGLLVFSPWLALGAAGAIAAWRRPGYAALRPLTVAAAGVALAQAKWFDWWGGWSYGYRPLVDLSAPLALFAIPLAAWVLARRVRVAALSALVAWSVLVQLLGAVAYDLEGWNARAGYRVALASGSVVDVDASAAPGLIERGGRVLEKVSMDVDEPRYRARLWSLSDNQIGYYAAGLPEALSVKAASSRNWLDVWREPPPPRS